MPTHHLSGELRNQVDVKIALIEVRPGHRAINQEAVDNLAASMRKTGLLTPILLSNRLGPESRVLIAGRHRLEAARQLEWITIPALVVEMSEANERLREISENLHRAELTAGERAEDPRITKVRIGQAAGSSNLALR
jgi:ParB/RepB/Spo0J family partition protein